MGFENFVPSYIKYIVCTLKRDVPFLGCFLKIQRRCRPLVGVTVQSVTPHQDGRFYPQVGWLGWVSEKICGLHDLGREYVHVLYSKQK